ncbi:Predicted N-acetyltransferase YhbS [Trichlorobacter thiogenes]|uniref:Predicted N-acetyltransferase YhbS n=1 Tax=Trichlorobacter thiogenes TaxID=115783 RepID=A0A1T4QEA8_9BACT|nr:GNAT family N-acetyltransferase [Trichlorobacter thiogenes]SKA02072.1 Predicted N-acetyltransferase YhbS [Trichlorobacter thiogenes]
MIIIKSNDIHLIEILAWLEREERESGEGFNCNHEIIRDSLQKGEVFCAVAGTEVVGFVVHNRKSVGASIDILEVKPEHRRRGIGKLLALDAIKRLFASGAEFITVECAPRRSEPFWRDLGFLPTGEPRRSIWENPRLILVDEG